MKDEPSHLSHVCFREPIHLSRHTCVSVNGFIFHVNTRWKMNRFIWFIINFIDSMAFSFTWIGSPSVPVKHIMMTRLMTSLCPSNGAVNQFTRTHGREREPWLDYAVKEIWKSWMAWKIIHVNTPVNGFTWMSLLLFTSFHGLSRPVCSCESIHLWLGSQCVYALT